MGNGTLSKPMGAEIMKILREDYEKMKTLGYGDDVIQNKIQETYASFMEQNAAKIAEESTAKDKVPENDINTKDSVTKPGTEASTAPTLAPAPAPAVKPTTAKPATAPAEKLTPAAAKKGRASGKGKAPTRRRSFENPQTIVPAPKAPTDEVAGTMAVSESTPILPTALPATNDEKQTEITLKDKDNWDSVSTMPYCEICKQAFKTPTLLERHVKYSDVHKKNIEKQKAEKEAAIAEENANKIAAGLAASGDIDGKKLIEGHDYKLYYFGSKFFWRTQENIDLSFFHHLLYDCIEVVPFEPEKGISLPRLYLNVPLLTLITQTDMELAKINALNQSKSSKFTQPKIDNDALLRKTLTTSILSRLNLETIKNKDNNNNNRQLKYSSMSADNMYKSPLLDKIPLGLTPVTVTHRRNTSTEEVKEKINELNDLKKELAIATKKAENVINHVQNFAKNMKIEFLLKSKMSKTRKRWVMAINKVLQIIGVSKTTKHLDYLEKKNKDKDIDKKVGNGLTLLEGVPTVPLVGSGANIAKGLNPRSKPANSFT